MTNIVGRWVAQAGAGSARALLLPRVAVLGARAPRNPHVGWNRFWAGVTETGDGGDVLWDTSSHHELDGYLQLIGQHLDAALPIVDVGCGNGRFTRALSTEFPCALGVDLSPHAVSRARDESAGFPAARYLAMDVTAAGAGTSLRAEVGEANVFVRGVFHVLDGPARVALAANLLDLVGMRGRVFLAETDFRGTGLGYIAHLGATARRIPHALAQAISSLPRPGHFGGPERIETFPTAAWELVDEGSTVIETVPLRGPVQSEQVPGYFAVLQRTR